MGDDFNQCHFAKPFPDQHCENRQFHRIHCNNMYEASNSIQMTLKPNKTEEYRMTKRRGRPIVNNAARERSRVKTLRSAFLELQRTLPAVPPDTKLSKLDVLVLATTYIAHLMSSLQEDGDVTQVFAANGCMHPVKKWPMRTRLYAGILESTVNNNPDCPESNEYQTTPIYQQDSCEVEHKRVLPQQQQSPPIRQQAHPQNRQLPWINKQV
ncbi:Transcription factor 24 [Mactra antiquata]